MDAKVKHLEFLQAAINRMAGNSFLLKGWAITLVGGLLALTFKELDRRYIYISFAVLAMFWLLDGYYLSLERRFRGLYSHVRKMPEDKIDFSMDTRAYGRKFGWAAAVFSTTLLVFYGGALTVELVLNRFL